MREGEADRKKQPGIDRRAERERERERQTGRQASREGDAARRKQVEIQTMVTVYKGKLKTQLINTSYWDYYTRASLDFNNIAGEYLYKPWAFDTILSYLEVCVIVVSVNISELKYV